MKATPSLACSNRFSVLEIDNDDNSEPIPTVKAVPEPPEPPERLFPRKKWEKTRLPRYFVISSSDEPSSSNSLDLDVELRTTDTGVEIRTRALVDSGATGSFIDRDFVTRNGIATKRLSRSVPVLNVDGTPNEAGAITEVVDVTLRYRRHAERILLAVTGLGKKNLILGYSWLKEHNPEVDWQTREVKLSRCPRRCEECRNELKPNPRPPSSQRFGSLSGHKVSYPSLRQMLAQLPRKLPESPDADTEDSDEDISEHIVPENPPEVEEGDRVFVVNYRATPAEVINATSTISQRIAEGFARNQPASKASLEDLVPSYALAFRDVFEKESFDSLPDHREWDHAIELTGEAKSIHRKLYPLSPVEQSELDKFLEENLSSGRIRPSKSPMAAPFFFVKKKDGSLRPVQDYRYLNSITVKNKYPLPLVDDLIHQLKGARFFTKLDVRWGYNNIRIRPGDEWKAAFRTNRGMFEPLVMFFGLTNSPATFQTMMNDIFADLIRDGNVCIYMDDILIFGQTREEVRRITKAVLARLREHRLYLKAEKCEFEKEQIEYLGLIISHNSVSMDPAKVAAVVDWPTPKNVRDVQSFLGFANFYRHFIEGFSRDARALFDLTKKDTPFAWTPECASAFAALKERIISAPVLTLPNDRQPFRIKADSSDFASGGVLQQLSEDDGKWHPVAFLSKSLSAVERN